MSENKNPFVVFFDSVGRTILGERIDSETTKDTLVIKNPAVVHILPNQQTGQLQLQILPLFFKEFLADKNEATYWNYNKKQITECKEIAFDFKLQVQYQQLFAPNTAPVQQQPVTSEGSQAPETIKLFDE
jgi:hypothetical protein